MEFINSFGHLNSSLPISDLVFGFGLITLAMLPKVGIGRSITLALKSLFSTLPVKSIRVKEVNSLLTEINLLHARGGKYIVVAGSKGIGKTCLIDTALHRRLGVIKVDVPSGVNHDDIVLDVLKKLTNIHETMVFSPTASAKRVIFFHKLMFGRSPILVLSVPEHSRSRWHEEVIGVAHHFVQKFGLRVIVDAPPRVRQGDSKKELFFYVELMSRPMIEGIRKYEYLFDILQDRRLDNVVWKVFGKYYGELDRVRAEWVCLEKMKEYVYGHLKETLDKNIINCRSDVKKIINVFHELNMNQPCDEIPVSVLSSKDLFWNARNRMFRIVRGKDFDSIVPLTQAIGLLLRHRITNETELRKLWDEMCLNN